LTSQYNLLKYKKGGNMKILYTLIYLIISSIPIYSDDFPDISSFKNTDISIPKVHTSSISKLNAQINSNQSAKGFCSIEQAADKLLKMANSNSFGFSDSGLIEDYAERVKKECGPFKYTPQLIQNPGAPAVACYGLGGECSNHYYSYTYNPYNCALAKERDKLAQIYRRLLIERDKKVSEHIKKVREIAMFEAKNIVSKKITQKLADNPFEQVRLSWADMYEMRKTLASILSEKYGIYNLTAAIDAAGQMLFSNMEYFSPIIALSGPAGFIALTGFPIAEETFQCNISIKNILLKGALTAAEEIILKVPIIKSNNIAGVFADRFIKNATIEEASKWIQHHFGDGLEVENVSVVKEYGKEFAIITIKSFISTGEHYSDKYKNKYTGTQKK
jgi:hypothetical protein